TYDKQRPEIRKSADDSRNQERQMGLPDERQRYFLHQDRDSDRYYDPYADGDPKSPLECSEEPMLTEDDHGNRHDKRGREPGSGDTFGSPDIGEKDHERDAEKHPCAGHDPGQYRKPKCLGDLKGEDTH